MVLKNVNLIPASFAEIDPQSDNNLYTRGKLDVFYTGLTADRRLFTEAFSSKLLKTIAYTPVVSHYNAEKDDFEGHATEQDIYGLVDPMVPPTLVEHDGHTWARCDVILYTGRPGQVGEIASKIIGHAQSLELRPETLKYKIHRDTQGNFENLEFLEGEFTGVSVLGNDQKPAFTGSHFFEALPPETFTRGKEMNLTIQEFAKLSWGEKVGMIFDALRVQYGENFWTIQDVYDNNVVYTVYQQDDNRIHMYRMKYKMTDEAVSFTSEPEEVHPSYEKLSVQDFAETERKTKPEDEGVNLDIQEETQPEPQPEQPEQPSEPAEPEPQNQDPEPESQEPAPQDPESQEQEPSADPEPAEDPAPESEPEPQADPDPEENNPSDPGQLSVEAGQKGSNNEETVSTPASTLSSAEQQELAAYRKEKKIGLINSYADMLNGDTLQEYVAKVDEYSYEELKSTLDALFVVAARNKAPKAEHVSTFTTWYPSTPKGQDGYAAYIGDLLKK